ncbi:hypothetical protein MKW94_019518 [Papaver nudicaule]|uniref:CCHC-type domain-containing protein n=1 Tax=Papaver nudicaule TaxID=74823 RepID=A0AA41VQL1_PAPNU|nr:hypothetical protein [Papaver nudicaule]
MSVKITQKVQAITMAELGRELGTEIEEESCANVEPLVPDASCTNNEVVDNDESCASSPAKKILGDPRISQTKGRKSEKSKSGVEGNSRIKSGIETKKKTKTCKSCGATGHDSRTCKKRKEHVKNYKDFCSLQQDLAIFHQHKTWPFFITK